MVRVIIQYLIPFIAPTLVYMAWLWYAGRRARKTGDIPPGFTKGGLFWTIIAGAVLLVISLAALAASGGVAPDSGVYQAPRFEDGRVIGPEYIPEKD